MTPFKRGQTWSIYVPRRSGGVVQRSTGTRNRQLADKMAAMVEHFAFVRQWAPLEAVDAKRITLAELWDAHCMNRVEHLLASAAKASEPLAADIVDRWIATVRLAPRTKAAYEQKVRALLGEDQVRVADLTAGWVVDRLAQLPHGAPTVRQYAHAFSVFCQYLRNHRLIAANPVRDVPLPKGTAKRTTWKSEVDDLRLVNAAPEPYRTYFALVHSTGAERDAALAMTRADLDLTAGTCHIPGTKTSTRDRRGVPIETWALPILTAHCRGMLPDAPLFPTLGSRDVNREHVAARNAVKLTGYQLRDARHSYAVRAILRGEPLWKVSKWLGHSNLAITATVYANFGLEEAQTELNRYTTVHATVRGAAS